MDAEHPVVLITGASGGIGRAVSLAYAERGARLLLLGRSGTRLAKLAAECQEKAGEAVVVRADVADSEAVRHAVERAITEFGRLDVVVHTAAVLAYGRLTDVPEHVWNRVIDVDVKGTANIARETLPVFERQRAGDLVVIGSILGDITAPRMGSYATSKWAQHGLVRVLQQEARQTPGVHVSLIAPGGIDTTIYRDAASYVGRSGSPPPPVLKPEAVARAVLKVVDHPRRKVDVGPLNRIMWLGFQFAPWLYDRLVGPLFGRLALGHEHVGPHEGNVFVATEDLTGRSGPGS
jgi:NAD(P)-dependent dehydrogenase (short-subunit alcohol dehydrogenase family)